MTLNFLYVRLVTKVVQIHEIYCDINHTQGELRKKDFESTGLALLQLRRC